MVGNIKRLAITKAHIDENHRYIKAGIVKPNVFWEYLDVYMLQRKHTLPLFPLLKTGKFNDRCLNGDKRDQMLHLAWVLCKYDCFLKGGSIFEIYLQECKEKKDDKERMFPWRWRGKLKDRTGGIDHIYAETRGDVLTVWASVKQILNYSQKKVGAFKQALPTVEQPVSLQEEMTYQRHVTPEIEDKESESYESTESDNDDTIPENRATSSNVNENNLPSWRQFKSRNHYLNPTCWDQQ